jgi:hypothetical protein
MSKVLAVLLELKECSDYWSEYAVPIGIHERIDAAIDELLAQPEHIPDVGSMVERINWLEDQLKQIEQDSPPKPEPLSDGEIYDLDDEVNGFVDKNVVRAVMRWIRAVEREHGIGADDE